LEPIANPEKSQRHKEKVADAVSAARLFEEHNMLKSHALVARTDKGATTAEYAVCTGAGVGFAGLLFKLLSSDLGQTFINGVFHKITSLLPF